VKIVVVSGLSGAGKTLAANCFEDMGFYCVDNLPPALIKDFVTLLETGKHKIDKIALVIDIRSGDFLEDIEKHLALIDHRGVDFKLFYLEAPKPVLLRRFAETRRIHPLAADGGRTNEEAIDEEIGLLAAIRERADFVINTADFNGAQLASLLREKTFGESEAAEKPFRIIVQSFGYKYGMPGEADFIFDMRFIPNPFYIDELREQTGLDAPVRDFVMKHEESRFFAGEIIKLLETLKPLFIKEGKPSLNIAFGCTGGQHRSVAMACEIAERLKTKGENIVLRHREI